MRLNTGKVTELMEKRGITEEMLPIICGVHCISDDCMISMHHAKKLSMVLGVEVSEITEVD